MSLIIGVFKAYLKPKNWFSISALIIKIRGQNNR